MPVSILFVAYLDAIDRGGQVNLLRLVERLPRDRFRPIVAVPGRGPLFSRLGELGVERIELEVPRVGNLLQEITRLPQRLRLSRAIERFDPHILYVDGVEQVRPLRVAAGPLRKIVWHAQTAVATPHDGDAVAAADVIVSVSPSVDARIESVGAPAKKVVSIPNAVDVEYFVARDDAPETADAARVVLTVAALERGKGIAELLHAIATSRHRDLRLDLVGRGEPREEARYKQLVAALGLTGRVRFRGRTPDVLGHYRAADLFVLPTYAEGLPLALLEAMAVSRACIASDVLGVRHLLEGGAGVLVPKADALALRDAIDRLLDAPEERARLGRAARARVVERFALPAFAGRFQSLFSELST